MDNELEKNQLTEEEIPEAAEEETQELFLDTFGEESSNAEPEEELPAQIIEEAPKAEKKKSTFKIVLISVVATLLVLVLAIGLTVGVLAGAGIVKTDGLFEKSTKSDYTVSEKQAPKKAKKVVGKIGDVKLTNGELQAYYKFNLLNLQQSEYAYYLYYYYGVDLTKPLDTIVYDETTGQTWQDVILENAITSWQEITVMNLQAEEEGFTLNEEQQAYLDSIDTKIQEMATASGFATVAEMIHSDIGISATEEGFRNFMYAEYYYSCYYSYLMDKFSPTQEQIETYFTENEQDLAQQGITKETYTVDVRHILIQPEGGKLGEDGKTKVYSDEEWEACYQKAQEILETWKAGEATEDSFAALAKLHSADGNASQGGLYTDVTKGYMVESFDSWIFDAARKYADVDIVKTEFGYHIMFFVGRQYTWGPYCTDKLLADSLQYAIDTAKEKYPMKIDYNKIVLS